MVDLFEEVEEELRAEQYKKLALKLAPWIVGGLVAGALIAAGAYGFVQYQERQSAKAATEFAAVLDSLNRGDTAGAYQQLNAVPKGSKAYKSLALMLQGGLRINEDRDADAVKLFDAAAKAAPAGKGGLILADSARLKAAWAVLDDAPYAEAEKRLKPLTEDGRPYKSLATEALAMAMLNAGKTAEARGLFNKLTIDPEATQGIAQRAKVAVNIIDSGAAKALPAVTKASKGIVPSPPAQQQISPEMLEQLRAQAQAQAAAQGGAGQ